MQLVWEFDGNLEEEYAIEFAHKNRENESYTKFKRRVNCALWPSIIIKVGN